MDYTEHAPPDDLRGHVSCAWRLFDPAPSGDPQTIYPDGCCELIVHLGAPPQAWDPDDDWHEQADTLFASQHLRPVRLRATAPLHCVGLRLTSEASGLLGPAALKRDRILDLACIDAALSRALRRAAVAFDAGDADALWNAIRRCTRERPIDLAVAAAVARIRASAGAVRIDGLARAVNLSPRSLQVRFRRHVGLTPKEFARVMRLRATLRALDGDEAIVDLAAERGFADQAHASRELRRITGLAPARLREALRRDRDGDVAIRLAAAFVRGYA